MPHLCAPAAFSCQGAVKATTHLLGARLSCWTDSLRGALSSLPMTEPADEQQMYHSSRLTGHDMGQGADLLAGPQAGPQAAHHNDAVPHQRRPASVKGTDLALICPSDYCHQIIGSRTYSLLQP